MRRYFILTFFLLDVSAWGAEVKTSIRSRDGEIVTTKRIREGQTLLYEYTLVVVQQSQAKFSETHAFYLNGEKIFTLFEMGKGKTQRWDTKSPAYAFYTVVPEHDLETVTLSARPGDSARWSFSRKGTGHFELLESNNSANLRNEK